jgi:hypothetical protein
MDTSSKGVNLRVRPTRSEERTLPLGSVAYFGMRLLWEYTCIRREGHDAGPGIVCADRGPVSAA